MRSISRATLGGMNHAPPIDECRRGNEVPYLDLVLSEQVVTMKSPLQLPDNQPGMNLQSLSEKKHAILAKKRTDPSDEAGHLILGHGKVCGSNEDGVN